MSQVKTLVLTLAAVACFGSLVDNASAQTLQGTWSITFEALEGPTLDPIQIYVDRPVKAFKRVTRVDLDLFAFLLVEQLKTNPSKGTFEGGVAIQYLFIPVLLYIEVAGVVVNDTEAEGVYFSNVGPSPSAGTFKAVKQ